MKKKADLSINIIIVTIIALVVLIVLTFVFTGRLTLFNKGLSDCAKIKDSSCTMGIKCDSGYIQHPTAVCLDSSNAVDKNNVCCFKQDTFSG